jgi:hypothetical protein
LETIFEDVSPDKVVKNIVKELNNEHQGSGFEKSSSPEGKDEPKNDNSTLHPYDHLAMSQMGPQRTSEFEQTNPNEGNPTIDQDIPEEGAPTNTSPKLPTTEEYNSNANNERADENENQKKPSLEEEHSTNNTHLSKHTKGPDDHVMNTDEFLNSSSEYERTAKIGDSVADEGTSILKSPAHVYLPPEILQGLKDLTPDEALNKLLSSSGIPVSTLPDQDMAMQRKQDKDEARFRREIIEGDMLELLERNPSLYPNIKALSASFKPHKPAKISSF